MANITDETKAKMAAAIDHLKSDLKAVRTSRANPAILDSVYVEVYGAQTRLKDIASITTPEPRLIQVSPFDPKNASTIAKAIEKANLGIQPVADGNLVRIKIPPMDEQRRKEMVKVCHDRREHAKVIIRNIRRDANDLIKRQKNDGILPEDQMKKLEKVIQDMTDKSCKEADELSQAKEKEVMTV